jgi:hypothetical protein
VFELFAIATVGEKRDLPGSRRFQRGDLGDNNVGIAEQLAAESLHDLGEAVSVRTFVHQPATRWFNIALACARRGKHVARA